MEKMVKEKEEMVERIDENVKDEEMKVEEDNNEIIRYFKKIKYKRWIMIKILDVIIFLLILFVIFME
jgi:t-SNARE complex subunit (syntaxin)